MRDAPKKGVLEQMEKFSGDEYFQLLSFIDQSYMKKAFPRLSALLQNLVERRSNRWQKHLSVAEGPKKLKDIQEDIEREEDEGKAGHKHSRDKLEQDKLDRRVKEMYEGWQAGKHEETREMREILKKHHEHAFYLSLLKQLADEKKDNVAKRVTLLPFVMDYDRFKPQDFKAAWLTAVRVNRCLFSTWPSAEKTSPSARLLSPRCWPARSSAGASWRSTTRSSMTRKSSISTRK